MYQMGPTSSYLTNIASRFFDTAGDQFDSFDYGATGGGGGYAAAGPSSGFTIFPSSFPPFLAALALLFWPFPSFNGNVFGRIYVAEAPSASLIFLIHVKMARVYTQTG